ncbi:hypothetical protein KKH05_00530 [Patescibacteria group bacterium]|nr:hypothetical protein [Patescibacteria group bacterium]
MSEYMLGESALAEAAGPLKTFFEKLAGSDGPAWLGAFKRFLRKEDPWPTLKFRSLKRVTLGRYRNVDSLKGVLARVQDANGVRIGDDAMSMIDMMSFVPLGGEELKLDLVGVQVMELGFRKPTTLFEVYKRAREQGWRLCPPEVGPLLRIGYLDQQLGKELFIAMEPIEVPGKGALIFLLSKTGNPMDWSYESQLQAVRKHGASCHPGDWFVFVAPITF